MNQSQAEFLASGGAPSQESRILDCLQAHLGSEVSLVTLWAISGSMAVHSRIAQLRKKGVQIVNRTERKNGATHSFYKLLTP
jgi:hypothetical protein